MKEILTDELLDYWADEYLALRKSRESLGEQPEEFSHTLEEYIDMRMELRKVEVIK